MENKDVGKTTEYRTRDPIVTFMGHVDHGKTSILDAIRKTAVQEGEYGGITQHIGAYQIEHNSKKITFIDTPGHAAFTQMRARGGKMADIVVLVVAADEGVMPQTKEAIAHAKAAGVTIIVALNKMDKAGANPKDAKQQLAQESIMVEDWGGDVVCVELSAKTGENLEGLLDAILAVSELLDLKCNPQGELEAVIIESKLDRKRGVVVTCVLRNGSMSVGQTVMASGYTVKIKSLMDDKGNILDRVEPVVPVELLGFKEVPDVGDLILSEGSDLADLARNESKVEIVGKSTKKTISIVLRADTLGTLEAVKSSLADLVTSSVEADYAIKFLYSATGDITESDIMLADAADGVVVGFDVRISGAVKDFAESRGVPVKTYKAIYELIDDASDLLEGTAREEEAKIKGRGQVLKIFKLPSGDKVLGCRVLAGAFKPKQRVAIYNIDPSEVKEEDQPLYIGTIKKLKKGRDDVSVAGKDTECGILLKPQYEEAVKDTWIEAL